MTCSHEHGLLAKLDTRVVDPKDALDDGPSFRRCVVAAVEARLRPCASVAVQAERRLAFGAGPDFIGHIEHALPRSEIAFELHRHSVGIATDELAQAARIGPPEAVDGLGLVADHREALSVWGQKPHDVHLEAVQVLVLVDQHVAKALRQLGAQLVVAHEGTPIQEQVIKIEEAGAAFASGEISKELTDDGDVGLTPWVLQWHQLAERALGIDASGVDIDEGGRLREPDRGPRQGVITPEEVH